MSHQALKWTRQHRSYPTATQQSAFEASSFFANKSPGRARPSEKPSPGASSFLLSPFPEGKGSRRNGDPPQKPAAFAGPWHQEEERGGIRGEQPARHRRAKLPSLIRYDMPCRPRQDGRREAARRLGFAAPLQGQSSASEGREEGARGRCRPPRLAALGSGSPAACSHLY